MTASRILVVANTFPPVHGGSAVVYDSLGRFGGGRISVLAPKLDYRTGTPIPGWKAFDVEAPFPVHRLPLLRTYLSHHEGNRLRWAFERARDLTIRIRLLRGIGGLVRSEQVRVLCIGELVASGWLARAAQRLFGLTCVIYVHGEEATTETPYDRDGRRRRQALAAADGIVAVSVFTRDVLVARFGVARDKIALIRNGVDLQRFTPRPRRTDLVARYGLANKRVLLTVGRLSARKGMDRVFECLPALRRICPDLVYLIVGEGPFRGALQSLAGRLGVAGSVVLAGDVPDEVLADHYALADVFIMANRTMPDGDTEGFGLVFLEANACGIPVIAGRDGGSADAVTDGVNGLVIDGDDPAAIGATVGRLLSDPHLCDLLRQQGLAVAGNSGWDRKVEAFLRYCDQLRDAATRRS